MTPANMPAEHEKPWAPLTPLDVLRLFQSATFPWWIAGGYAIELALGRSIRPHHDIDVLILRRNQLAAQALLRDYDCWAADPPGTLRRWLPGETLPLGIHDIWCRETPAGPWKLQLMIDESDGEEWRSRRCREVHRPLKSLGGVSRDGIPYLSLEVQLYGKAKAPREKDEIDLAAALPVLEPHQRAWLAEAIATAFGSHPWICRL